MGKGDAILVVACDLHEEAPLWWLRVRQAAQRGAAVIVANPRPTRTDAFASHIKHYEPGGEAAYINSLIPSKKAAPEGAAKVFSEAANAVIIYGSEGVGLSGSQKLAAACAELLIQTGHVGRANNGLMAAWRSGNTQGAWDMGFRPSEDLHALRRNFPKQGLLFIAGADPAGDDPDLARAVDLASFVIVQELFLTETAKRADIVFPRRRSPNAKAPIPTGSGGCSVSIRLFPPRRVPARISHRCPDRPACRGGIGGAIRRVDHGGDRQVRACLRGHHLPGARGQFRELALPPAGTCITAVRCT